MHPCHLRMAAKIASLGTLVRPTTPTSVTLALRATPQSMVPTAAVYALPEPCSPLAGHPAATAAIPADTLSRTAKRVPNAARVPSRASRAHCAVPAEMASGPLLVSRRAHPVLLAGIALLDRIKGAWIATPAM
jgi:hypothetical protein